MMTKHIYFLTSLICFCMIKAEITDMKELKEATSAHDNQPIESLIPQEAFEKMKLDPALEHSKKNRKKKEKLISFNFENEELSEIINYLALEKQVNIVLPAAPITAKVTLKHQEKLSLDNAFKLLNTLLDVAGYIMTPHGKDEFIISKLEATSGKDTFPVYIGVSPDSLPDSDERIRYLYYFNNIRITDGGPQTTDIETIVKDMLMDTNKPTASSIQFNYNTNCIIITGKSYSIKVAMQIISELDKTGFREVIEVVKLINTNAQPIAKFLMEQLIAPTTQQPTVTPPGFDGSFFSKTMKVLPDNRTNSLIILGKVQAVERLKNFIYKYIDVPLESGESILHVYELQYLDAQTFAEDLKAILKPPEGQSQSLSAEQRAFADVIIDAEKTGVINPLDTKAGEVGKVYQGGNRLIIAARKSEWIKIKRLIADLDKPQPQVALEVLVVDVTLEQNKILGSQVRNKVNALTKNVNAQAAELSSPVLTNPPVNLIANLLTFQTDGLNLASRATPGSTIITVNDRGNNGIWWVAQVLQEYTNSKILSHPYVTTLNQVQAKISISDVRLVQGQAKQNPDGTLTVNQQNLPADLTVEILPKINLSNSINLQIAVKVNNFVASASSGNNTRTTRTFITDATIGNGEILVLGGLISNNEQNETLESPPWSKIPLIGWMFKSRNTTYTKDSLMVFISPSVIKPHTAGGMSESTVGKYDFARNDVHQGQLFDQIRDPITRWFFKSPRLSIDDMVDDYGTEAFFSEAPLHTDEPVSLPKPLLAPKKNPRQRKSKLKRFEPEVETRQESPPRVTHRFADASDADKLKALAAKTDNPLKNMLS